MPLFCPPWPRTKSRRAFTILEVLITVGLLLVILVAVVQFFDSVDRAWRSGAEAPFAEAQNAFETVAHNLADATLESYQDYADAGGAFRTNAAFVPDHLARRSDLAFVCGPAAGTSGLLASSQRTTTGNAVFFTAPEGLSQTYANNGLTHLLNAMGYFVEFGDDDSMPAFLAPFTHRYRWRLKQVEQPSESLQVYTTSTSSPWIQNLAPSGSPVPILAENIVTLLVLPERDAADSGAALSPAYSYDSRDPGNKVTLHQLPPRVRLVLVAIDSVSADRLAAQNGSSAPSLVPAGSFQQAAQLDSDLTSLDVTLTAQKIGHRFYQREIQLPSSDWSSTASQ